MGPGWSIHVSCILYYPKSMHIKHILLQIKFAVLPTLQTHHCCVLGLFSHSGENICSFSNFLSVEGTLIPGAIFYSFCLTGIFLQHLVLCICGPFYTPKYAPYTRSRWSSQDFCNRPYSLHFPLSNL